MRRVLTATLLAWLIISTAYAQETLKTGIEWDENKARTLALKHLETEIDVSLFREVDPKYWENQKAKEDANTKMALRQVTFFQAGEYAVAYQGENIVNYYRANGKLLKVSICSTPFGIDIDYANYPRKCVEYGYPEGKMISVSLDVAPQESFVFLPDGSLKNHWKGSAGYDDQSQLRWHREAR